MNLLHLSNLLTGCWCTNGTNLQLVCPGRTQGPFVFIQAISLLITQATEVAKFMTNLTLVLACWTPKPFSVEGVTTFWISVWHCVLRIKSSFIFLWPSWFFIIKHVGFFPKLEGFIFPLGLAGWYLCALMSQEINLYCLWVSCDLFNMFYSGMGTFQLLFQLAHCTCWKLT